ncbi:MAG: putative lipid II flippase FtsW [Acidimicrobiales bacterium]
MPTDTATLTREPKKPTPTRAATVDPSLDETGWVLLAAIVAMLCTIGLMMVLSASSVEGLRSYGGAWVFFTRQIMWVAIGSAVLTGATLADYHHWRRAVPFLLGASFVMLVLVLVPGVGITAGGSSRWLGTDSFRVQPSEFAKLAVLVFGAALLARRVELVGDWRSVMRPLLVTTGLIAGLVLVQPDMGTTLLMFFIVFVLMFVGGVRLVPMATLAVVGSVVSVILAKVEGYRWERVSSFRDPFGDFENTGYQVAQSLVALGTGHVGGVGLGASRAKWGFLPNAHTDFIFAIVGEELGLIGTCGVVGLFVAFAVLGVRTALRAPDRFGALLAAGVTAWVCGQAFVNMGAVTSLLPVTGVPLPFVSFGGSSLVVTMAATGILLNVARQARRPPAPALRPTG